MSNQLSRLLLGCLLFSATAMAESFEGSLDIEVTDDFNSHKSELHFYLKDKSGKRSKLKLKDSKSFENLKPGTKIKLKGKKINEEIDVDALEATSSATESNISEISTSLEAAPISKKIAALLVNTSDGSAYASKTSVTNYMFNASNSLRNHYLKITHGQIDFLVDSNADGAPDVFGPLQISAAGTTNCDTVTWASQADSAAKAAGVDLSIYDHIVYVLPANTNCTWAGLAQVVGKQSWIKQGDSFVYIHELGHNLGLRHAGTDPENDGRINNSYGDTGSPTGGYNFSGFNAPHSEQMGMHSRSSGAINENISSGLYDLYPLGKSQSSINGNQILKIPNASKVGENYYLSFRTKEYADSTIPNEYLNGLSIHSSNGSSVSRFIKRLLPGESFADATSGINIEAVSITGSNEFISIRISKVCMASTASLSASTNNVVMSPNSSISFNLVIKNNDNSNCPSTNFSLSNQVHANLAINLQQNQIQLAAQQSVSIPVSIKDLGLSGNTNISFTLSDNDGLEPKHANVSSSLNISVDTSAPTSPVNLSASVNRKGAVSLNWQSSSDSGSGLSHYNVYRNNGSGFQKLGQATSNSFNDSNPAGSSLSYYVIAVDKAGNQSSQSNTVSLSISTKGGGGSGKGGSGGGPGKGSKK